MHFTKLLCFSALATAALHSQAQSMSSPYSAYAIGDIDSRNYNFNSGMGYTGLALKTSLFQYGTNPASLAGMEKKFFTLDASAAGRSVGYTGTAIDATNSSNHDFTIKKISLSTKVTDFWASGIGMRQFSNVSYKFQNQHQIEGTNTSYDFSYSGDGGLNEYYWNNAFALGKHLSVGVTTSFLAGPINQTETLVDASGNTITSVRRDYYARGRVQYGAIYSGNISKNWIASIGANYASKTTLNFERTLNVTDNSTAIITNEYLQYNHFTLPQSLGTGVALSNKGGTETYAADYTFNNWSAMNVKSTNWALVNSSRISAGAEFSSFKKLYNATVAKRSFQLGAFMDNSYLRVNNYQIREWGLTAGMTRSLGSSLLIGASLEGGVRGTTQAALIRENFVQLSLHLSYRDFLFGKTARYN
jgi:hypothetical protein